MAQKGTQDFTDETIITTPKPSASSTVDKRLVQRNFGRHLAENPTPSIAQSEDDSLGLISIQSNSLLDGQYLKQDLSDAGDPLSQAKAQIYRSLDKRDAERNSGISTVGRKSGIMSGDRKSSTMSGGRQSSTMLGDRKSSTMTGDRKSSTMSGDRQSSTMSGDRKSSTISGDRKSSTISGDRKSSTMSGDRNSEIISADRTSRIKSTDRNSGITSSGITPTPRVSQQFKSQLNHVTPSYSPSCMVTPIVPRLEVPSCGLPSRYLKASEMRNMTQYQCLNSSESTVNESDLLKDSLSNFREREHLEPMSKTLESLSAKFRSSNMGIKDLRKTFRPSSDINRTSDINQTSNLNRMSNTNRASNMNIASNMNGTSDTDCFVPGEFAQDKLLADEMSWRKAKDDIPIKEVRKLSLLSEASNENWGKCSIGEFFRGKNGDMTDIFSKKSPEKSNLPVPLIEASYLNDSPVKESFSTSTDFEASNAGLDRQSSVLRLSQIQRLLSGADDDSPNKLMDMLMSKGIYKSGRTLTSIQECNSNANSTQDTIPDTEKLDFKPSQNSTFSEDERDDRTSCSSKLTSDFEPPQHSTFAESLDVEARKNSLFQGNYPRNDVRKLHEYEHSNKHQHSNKHEYGHSRIQQNKLTRQQDHEHPRHHEYEQPSIPEYEQPRKPEHKQARQLEYEQLRQLEYEQLRQPEHEQLRQPEFEQLRQTEYDHVSPTTERQSINCQTYISPNTNPMLHTGQSTISPQSPSKRISSYNSRSLAFSERQSLPPMSTMSKENKENVHQNIMSSAKSTDKLAKTPEYDGDRSMSSVRSGSSLDTLANGKLPIEATKSELVWGCVKLGKSVSQKFTLRNKSDKKIRFQISVSGNAFKVAKTETEHVSSFPVLLHPLETRSITVTFSPTAVGGCVEKLSFLPVRNSLQTSRQLVRLFGFGGHSSVDLQNILRDSTGRSWLSLGCFADNTVITKDVYLVNNGNLSAFVYATFTPDDYHRHSNVQLKPTKVAIKPKEEIKLTFTYTPGKEALQMQSNAMGITEIGNLKLVTGDEPTRARIRRLCRKAKKSLDIVDQLAEELNTAFENEVPPDTNRFSETIGAMKDLTQRLMFKNITITLEQDPERTVGIDDTSMFQTLCLNNSNETYVDATMINKASKSLCTVEPSSIILTPPIKSMDTVLLSSASLKPVQFRVVVESTNENNLLEVSPREGVIPCGEMAILQISCPKVLTNGENGFRLFKVRVNVDKELTEIDVKVVFVQQAGFKYNT